MLASYDNQAITESFWAAMGQKRQRFLSVSTATKFKLIKLPGTEPLPKQDIPSLSSSVRDPP